MCHPDDRPGSALTVADIPQRSAPQQGARHQFLHDLRRAAIDAQHARVGPEARDRVFGHVAVAAEELQAGVGDAPEQLGGV